MRRTSSFVSTVTSWPWLLLALLLLGALVWFLLHRRGARVELRAWDERLVAAELEASWVEDSLTDEVMSRSGSAEAQSIWTAAQPLLLTMDETFRTLAGDAPDPPRACRADDLRGLLRGLTEAIGADLATAPSAD